MIRTGSARAAALASPGKLELLAVEPPKLRDGKVLVRVVASSICGTDLKIHEGAIPVASGRVLGHEGAGEVVETAGDVPLEPGMRVVIDPVIACGDCAACRDHRPNLCARGGLIGRDNDGVFADYVRIPASNCHPLPTDIGLEEAPMLQQLAADGALKVMIDHASG